jgi:hypothetical protein
LPEQICKAGLCQVPISRLAAVDPPDFIKSAQRFRGKNVRKFAPSKKISENFAPNKKNVRKFAPNKKCPKTFTRQKNVRKFFSVETVSSSVVKTQIIPFILMAEKKLF